MNAVEPVEPPRDASEAELSWAVRRQSRGHGAWASLLVVTMLVPLAIAVCSFVGGDVLYGVLFLLPVVAQMAILALIPTHRYLLGPGGVTRIELARKRSHRWSEFETFRREGTDVLLVFDGPLLRTPLRLLAPANTDDVVAYVETHLPQTNSEPEADER